jgi:hypothetical protein
MTTRVARGMFDPAAEARLVDLFRANVERCPEEFVASCADLLDGDPLNIDPATCSDGDYLNLMIVALGKWLASLVEAHGAHRVELASTQGYRVEPTATCEDLVSIAMRFTPVIAAPPDPLAPQAPVADECETAAHVAKRVSARKDLDDILAGNADLYEGLVAESEALLEAARYDIAGYRAWLRAGPV